MNKNEKKVCHAIVPLLCIHRLERMAAISSLSNKEMCVLYTYYFIILNRME
jgi:hypothetical protein